MPSVAESETAGTPLNAALEAGLDALSLDQQITFFPYVRLVLPLDGFVFYVRAELLSATALANAGVANAIEPNQLNGSFGGNPLPSITAGGSLHFSTDLLQEVDQTLANNHIIFSAKEPVRELDDVNPNILYIGQFQGKQFAFKMQGQFYAQAEIWHYRGDAINGAMAAQIIDNPETFDSINVVTSNSLAIWLTLNRIMPIYPSFLVPANIPAPYAAVDIDPARTEAIQASPNFDLRGNHYQLVKDHVKITIYGLRNFNALDFQDYVFQYSLDTDNIGIMGSPVMRDEKRTQPELAAIAMKKSFELDVSYYQTRIHDIARQFIRSCVPTYYIVDL